MRRCATRGRSSPECCHRLLFVCRNVEGRIEILIFKRVNRHGLELLSESSTNFCAARDWKMGYYETGTVEQGRQSSYQKIHPIPAKSQKDHFVDRINFHDPLQLSRDRLRIKATHNSRKLLITPHRSLVKSWFFALSSLIHTQQYTQVRSISTLIISMPNT
jgi:hypothetical protein